MDTKDLRTAVLFHENPLTDALDHLHGVGNWDEQEADALGEAIITAIDTAEKEAGDRDPA